MNRKRKDEAEALYLRDNRKAGWFWAHNELIDVFAPLVGPYGVAVYVALVSRCKGNSAVVECSVRELENLWLDPACKGSRPALGRSSISRALSQLAAAGMIRVSREATRSRGAEYLLVDLPDLYRRLAPTDRERLVSRLEGLRDRSVPEGDTQEIHQPLLKSSGKACVNPQFSTEIPGTHVSPTGTDVSPTGTLSIKDSKTINPIPTLPGGKGSESTFSPAQGPAPDLKQYQAAWSGVVDDLVRHFLGFRNSFADSHETNLYADIVSRLTLAGIRLRAGQLVLVLRHPYPADAKQMLARFTLTPHQCISVALAKYFNPVPTGFEVYFPFEEVQHD